MSYQEIKLSSVDSTILNSYKTLVDGLAQYLGTGCEIVLHSLENLQGSVIKIVNGEHTGRKEGAPITDFALNMLKQIQQSENADSIVYNTTNRKGEAMKSCTIAIRGENNRCIGMLCINFYLNTPLSTLLSSFMPAEPISAVNETFATDTQQLVQQAVIQATAKVEAMQAVLPSMRNKEIINILLEQGIFRMKDAVVMVADFMHISKNTVYLHLRTINNNQ